MIAHCGIKINFFFSSSLDRQEEGDLNHILEAGISSILCQSTILFSNCRVDGVSLIRSIYLFIYCRIYTRIGGALG